MIDDNTDKIFCDNCNKEIKKDQKYYEINDDEFRSCFEDYINQFCSKECILKFLDVREYVNND